MVAPAMRAVAWETVLPLLRCPQCADDAGPLQRTGGREIGCPRGHRFDPARQGYLPLLGGSSRTDTGDSAEMIAARADFLGRGHYDPIAAAVAGAVGEQSGSVVCEIGAGTAHYLAQALPDNDHGVGIALDSSRYAARRAAAADPRVASILADAWAPLPLRDDCVDAVLVIFAPRVATEIRRILRPGGVAVVVSPTADHLSEVREALGMLGIEGGKHDAVREQFAGLLEVTAVERVRAPMVLTSQDLGDLVSMGPAARHRSSEQIAAAVRELGDQVEVHLEVSLTRLVAR